ncbi:hypothetical protein Ahu01nite_017310 [Winogradskya humida]|uniref:Intracellular proteinase inhibitor BsuPI domain-containing protein n=1 Tax=Winogradskya humida TaxID=113566 RepID=A0ABQ3ZJD8_9ACTN|nr:hypothetical protein Ahu01nite_017310 [Actinoplanes humidus]
MVLDYVVRNDGAPVPVQLGASLFGRTGHEYFDPRSDRKLWLRTGTTVYRRSLRLPSDMPAGRYRLVVAVWWLGNEKRSIASADCGERL